MRRFFSPFWVCLVALAFSPNVPARGPVLLSDVDGIVAIPSSVDFGSQQQGTTTSRPILLENANESDDIVVHSISFDPADPAFSFAVPPTTPFIITDGSLAALPPVQFKPPAAGAYATTLIIESDSEDTPTVRIPLSGTGTEVPPSLVATPTSLNFPNQQVGTPSPFKTVTLQNTGTATVHVTSFSVSDRFEVQGVSSSFAVAPKTSVTVNVRFTPIAQGVVSGTLHLLSDDPGAPSLVIDLTGTGVLPALVVNPSALDFGSQVVNSSASQTVELSNTGITDLTVNSLSCDGDFKVGGQSAPFTLAAGAKTSLPVTFTPTAPGHRTGTLKITSTDPLVPLLTVNLSGTGTQVPPSLVATPSALFFGSQPAGTTSASQIVTLSNTGTASLIINTLTLSNGFTMAAPTAPFTLDAGATVEVQVSFAPASPGLFSGKLNLTSTDPAVSTLDVILSGLGTQGLPSLVASPSALTFGDQPVGTTSASQTVTLNNTGSRSLVIQSAVAAAGYSVVGPSTPFTLAAGAQQTLQVSFSPTSLTAYPGTLRIASDDPAVTLLTLPLSGTGSQGLPSLVATPSLIDFGSQRVNTESAARTLTLSNGGANPIVIQSLSQSSIFRVKNSPAPPFIVAAGGQQELQVTFTPDAAGSRASALVLSTSDPAVPTLTVSLQGTGVVPALVATPASLDFGSQPVGTTSPVQTVIITNTGSSSLVIDSITLSFGFTPTLPDLPVTLTAGGHLSVPVAFSPSSLGARTGALVLTTTDSAIPTFTVSLSGTGTQGLPALVASPSSLDFGSQPVGTTSASQTLTLNNTGSSPVVIQSLAAGTGFKVVGPTTPFTLAAGAQQLLQVSFSPTAPGPNAGTLTLASTDPAVPTLTVPLSGGGTQGLPSLIASPSSLSFGGQPVGTESAAQTLTLSNTGSSPVVIQSLAVGTGFQVKNSPTTPFTLAAGAQQAIQITFTPDAAGSFSRVLVLTSTDPTVPTLTVFLSGTGGVPTAQLSQSQLSVPARVGTQVPWSVMLRNVGKAPLTVSDLKQDPWSGAAFSVDSVTLPLTLPPGVSQKLTGTFHPTASGDQYGEVELVSDDPENPTTRLTLWGHGYTAGLTPEPTQLDFGSQLVGLPSKTPGVATFRNTSNAPINILSVAFSGESASQFRLVAPPTLPLRLDKLPAVPPDSGPSDPNAPASTLRLQVSFTPSATAKATADLVLTTDNLEMPQVVVSLRGEGLASVLTISPAQVDLGSVDISGTVSGQVVLTNVSSSPVTLDSPKLDTPQPGQFTFEPASTQLAPGESVPVTVRYTATTPATIQAQLIFPTRDPLQPRAAQASLSVKVVPSRLEASPQELDFGPVAVGAKSNPLEITLTNQFTTARQVDLSQVRSPQASFQVDLAQLAAPIPPGGSVTLQVRFAPTNMGVVEDMLTLPLMGDNASLATIKLRGEGRTVNLQGGGQSCSSTGGGMAVLGLLALLSLCRPRRQGGPIPGR